MELYEYSDENPPVQISTTISKKERREINKSGYKYNDLILIGLIVKQAGFDLSLDEINHFKKNGWTLNDVIRKGIHAMENNISILERLKKVEEKLGINHN